MRKKKKINNRLNQKNKKKITRRIKQKKPN